jgi:hypothetical protein
MRYEAPMRDDDDTSGNTIVFAYAAALGFL